MDSLVPSVAYMPFIIGALPFIVVIVIFVVLFRYLLGKKQLEHQQIMAAIEKGTPLSELRPVSELRLAKQQKKEVDWIKSLTTGIALLLIGLGLIIIVVFTNKCIFGDNRVGLFIAVIFLAVGISKVLRGILKRKYDKAFADKSALDANQGH
jgi:predicted lysophospholipase L1 biosynthesis ABC-type transport system permease subunit